MKLHHVPARTGWLWVRLGMRTFLRQPLALAGLFFLFMMLVSVLAMVPLLGNALALALLPAATLGLMVATREADHGQFPMPTVLASAFRAGKQRLRAMLVLASAFRAGQQRLRAMLVLGGLYALGSLLVMGLTALLVGPTVVTLGESADVGEALRQQPILLRQLVVTSLLYLPLGLLFWHAPALVHWHGISPMKSLFFSAMACWTNKGALLVYFLGWTVVFSAIAMGVVTVAALLGSAALVGAVLFPLVMLMSAMFFSSLYYTFRDSFTTDDGQAPA